MLRVAMRGSMIVLALVFVFAGVGTMLCDMDCAAHGHAASTAAAIDGAARTASAHCGGEQNETSRHNMPASQGSSSRNTKHTGVHLHPRIVATTTARIQISPALTLSDFAGAPVYFSSAIPGQVAGNSWSNNSSPPIKSPSIFSTGVLRI